MSYSNDKKLFLKQVAGFMDDKGKTINLNLLIIQVGLKYGFGKNVVLNAFKQYEEIGLCEINESKTEVKILDLKK